LNVRLDTGRFKRLLITGVFPMLRWAIREKGKIIYEPCTD
jgi:hypothetical protein